MKTLINYLFISLNILISGTVMSQEGSSKGLTEHEQWLKNKFALQHNNLIPKVAVADILFACNIANNHDFGKETLKELIIQTSKERLAEKLSSCLGEQSVKSELAINYGLIGCFHDQLDGLPIEEQEQKIKLVKKAIDALSKIEKQKSFTQCVTDQTIGYLK